MLSLVGTALGGSGTWKNSQCRGNCWMTKLSHGNDWTGLHALRSLAWDRLTSQFFSALPRQVQSNPISFSFSQKLCRYGTRIHGLVVDLAVLGLWLDSMIFNVFFNLNDPMILLFYGDTVILFFCKKKKKTGDFSPSWRSSLTVFDWQTWNWFMVIILESLWALCCRGRKREREGESRISTSASKCGVWNRKYLAAKTVAKHIKALRIIGADLLLMYREGGDTCSLNGK